MKFINTDGMAFIGPGSEWFWTALSGIILAVTFIAIYRQLRLQAAAASVETLESLQREIYSERMHRNHLALLLALSSGSDAAHLPDGPAAAVANMWERIATLSHMGHVDRSLLWNLGSSVCQGWWAILGPWVANMRAETGQAEYFEDFEWLARYMADTDRRAGAAGTYAVPTGLDLEKRIASLQERIGIDEALRSVIVRAPDDVSPAKPTARHSSR